MIRTCLLYDFKFGVTAAESCRRICSAFGADVVSERTAQEWFKRFRTGDTSVQDRPRSGRPSEVCDERLLQLVEADPHANPGELAEALGVSDKTIVNHLHVLGKVRKLDQWIPHELTDWDRHRRADAAASLLSYRRTTAWLDTIVTGDEKWVLYVNIKRKRSWADVGHAPQAQPKASLHPQKVMLCVWWDSKGILYWELLPSNTTITAALYSQQLDRLAAKIAQVRPGLSQVRFLHDNARPHVAKLTREKLLQLNWEVLVHPPYSPDIAPSDYHLFRSLSNTLQGENFTDEDEIKKWLENFFASKPAHFYKDGIHSLPER